MSYLIKGDWLTAEYDLGERASMVVEIEDASRGYLLDVEHASRLWVARYGNDVFITGGRRNFVPDAGEIARLGVTPIDGGNEAAMAAARTWAAG